MDRLKFVKPYAAAIALSLTLLAGPGASFAGACKKIAGVPNKGCVDKRDLKKNAVTGAAIKKKAVTAKKLSKALSDLIADVEQPTLADSTGKEIGPNLGRSQVIMASDVDGTLFFVTVRRLRFTGLGNDVYFAGANCTGQAYAEDDDRLLDRALFQAEVSDNKAYLLQNPDQVLTNVAVMSRASINFADGTTDCVPGSFNLTEARRLIVVKDLGSFTTPFSAEW